MDWQFKSVSGSGLVPWIEPLADLRIRVFREYPYLYDGSLDYEKTYLETYVKSARSLVGLAFCGEVLAGATTCIPLADEDAAFRRPFEDKGYEVDRIFYFGESLILPEFRGQRTGHRFFALREAHARATLPHLALTAFCAVDRGDAHPLRPGTYRPLDAFWTRIGYEKHPELTTRFSWKDIDKDREDEKTMVFWLKSWTPSRS